MPAILPEGVGHPLYSFSGVVHRLWESFPLHSTAGGEQRRRESMVGQWADDRFGLGSGTNNIRRSLDELWTSLRPELEPGFGYAYSGADE